MRYRGNGGLLGPINSTSNTGASGFWSMPEFRERLLSSTWPTDLTNIYFGETYFKNTTFLLKAIGANNAQNYTFLDSSTNNFAITRNGDTTQGSFSPYGIDDGKWSVYFDGTGDYLSGTSWSSAGNFGVGDFTVECWVYATAAPQNNQVIWTCNIYPNTTGLYLAYYGGASNNLGVRAGATTLIDSSAGWQFNTWLHVAVVRSSGTLTLYINGTNRGSTTFTNNCTDGLQYIGRPSDTSNYAMQGYLSNIRITKSAVYTTNFTSATAGLTAISNTSLLICQSNRFKDNSTNNFAIAPNGDAKISADTPFNQFSPYSTALYGGSAYFDGSGDYLSCAANAAFAFGTGDFTVEAWIMRTGGSGNQPIMQSDAIGSSTNDKWWFAVAGTGLFFGTHASGGFNIQTTTTFNTNEWYHVAVTRSSGTMKMFVNGVDTAFATSGTPSGYSLSQNGFVIGGMSTPSYWTGYISNARVIKGTSIYNASFTPPTSPLTAVSGTSLLTLTSNASIVDGARKSPILTRGNTKVSTSVIKYDKSVYFDGTSSSYLLIPNSEDFYLKNADFTIEMWVRFNSLGDGMSFLTKGWGTINAPILIYYDGTASKLSFYSSSSGSSWDIANNIAIINSPSLNTWYHIAITRSGSTFRLFKDGTQTSTFTSSASLADASAYPIIVGGSNAGTNLINAYIEDLRITRGVARYTGAFTPPTQSFNTL